uniref:Uncharacterized protein n=1 Tax=Sphenodon punctatus TaxID=8508 RepID=A0A8D0GSI0_SPHPU
VLRLGEALGHEGRVLGFEPPPAEALGRLGHVIAPLGLVELHLLLGVGEEGEVGERLLLAQVGAARQPALHAARLEDLQLARLLHARRFGALLHHGLGRLARVLVASQLRVRPLLAQLHILEALEVAPQHLACNTALSNSCTRTFWLTWHP